MGAYENTAMWNLDTSGIEALSKFGQMAIDTVKNIKEQEALTAKQEKDIEDKINAEGILQRKALHDKITANTIPGVVDPTKGLIDLGTDYTKHKIAMYERRIKGGTMTAEEEKKLFEAEEFFDKGASKIMGHIVAVVDELKNTEEGDVSLTDKATYNLFSSANNPMDKEKYGTGLFMGKGGIWIVRGRVYDSESGKYIVKDRPFTLNQVKARMDKGGFFAQTIDLKQETRVDYEGITDRDGNIQVAFLKNFTKGEKINTDGSKTQTIEGEIGPEQLELMEFHIIRPNVVEFLKPKNLDFQQLEDIWMQVRNSPEKTYKNFSEKKKKAVGSYEKWSVTYKAQDYKGTSAQKKELTDNLVSKRFANLKELIKKQDKMTGNQIRWSFKTKQQVAKQKAIEDARIKAKVKSDEREAINDKLDDDRDDLIKNKKPSAIDINIYLKARGEKHSFHETEKGWNLMNSSGLAIGMQGMTLEQMKGWVKAAGSK
jgi:hypothetical protein